MSFGGETDRALFYSHLVCGHTRGGLLNPICILLIGMGVVVAGILVLRLHAFLALTAAALVVAALTPTANVYRQALRQSGRQVSVSAGSTTQPIALSGPIVFH